MHPQTFAELFQLLSSLIPQFELPKSCLPLCLYHPDQVTGVIDWGGAQILPLMFTATYPDDLMATGDDPCQRPGYPDENWRSVPCDWTSVGDTSQWPQEFRGPDDPVDLTPRAYEMVRRFYLRTHFSACYAAELHAKHGDTDLGHATLFADVPYYLKFYETVCGSWTSWVEHASWIRETYWRLRVAGGRESETLIVGPNVYRGSVQTIVRDLGIFEESHARNEEN